MTNAREAALHIKTSNWIKDMIEYIQYRATEKHDKKAKRLFLACPLLQDESLLGEFKNVIENEGDNEDLMKVLKGE